MSDTWETVLAHCDVMMGPFTITISCGIRKVEEGRYIARIGTEEVEFHTVNDKEAVKEGMKFIGEVIFARLQRLDGNPFVYPIIEGNEEEG